MTSSHLSTYPRFLSFGEGFSQYELGYLNWCIKADQEPALEGSNCDQDTNEASYTTAITTKLEKVNRMETSAKMATRMETFRNVANWLSNSYQAFNTMSQDFVNDYGLYSVAVLFKDVCFSGNQSFLLSFHIMAISGCFQLQSAEHFFLFHV